jgi:cell division protein FtsI (penicillin-binding protein 3)
VSSPPAIEPETAREVEGLGIEGSRVEPTLSGCIRRVPGQPADGASRGLGEPFGGVEASYEESLKSGEDVTLTLDTAVQQELEKALEFAVEKNDAKRAVGLVMRVEDGAHRGAREHPRLRQQSLRGRAPRGPAEQGLTDPYEPGSTFKAITVASALEEGAVTEDTTFVVADHIVVATA